MEGFKPGGYLILKIHVWGLPHTKDLCPEATLRFTSNTINFYAQRLPKILRMFKPKSYLEYKGLFQCPEATQPIEDFHALRLPR